ncbi:MAG: hypothetical protein ACOWWM_09355 [Desulfobacterales bacterium]
MTMTMNQDAYRETLEYHGSTTVERIRERAGRVLWKEWLEFDSVEEARDYFNEEAMNA